MAQRKRLKSIVAYLADHHEVTVEEACALFAVSPATIRRDFNQLAQEHKITKTWGGIRLTAAYNGEGMISAGERSTSFLAEKKRIAQ